MVTLAIVRGAEVARMFMTIFAWDNIDYDDDDNTVMTNVMKMRKCQC
jgi:hypothetical protein